MKRSNIALSMVAIFASVSAANAAVTQTFDITSGATQATLQFTDGSTYDLDAFKSDTATNYGDIYKLQQDAALQDTEIKTAKDTADTAKTVADNAQTTADKNTADIASNKTQNDNQDIRLTNAENHTNAVDNHVQDLDIQQRKDDQTLQAHSGAITGLQSDVNLHEQRLGVDETNIGTNKTTIAANKADITANSQHIATAESEINSNTQNIGANEKSISANGKSIFSNEQHIAANSNSIVSDEHNIAANRQGVVANGQSISTLQSGVKQAEATGEYAQSRADVAFTHAEANKRALAATNQRVAADDAELANHEQRISALESQNTGSLAKLKNQVDENRRRASAGISGVAAMANIPQVTNSQNFSVGAGVGTADSESALAVGFSARATENTVVKASVSDDSQHNFVAGAGVSYGW
jgi:chromosome segregation ATPase